MQLAYIYGRTPHLAHKELEATATILPFRWSLLSVQTNIDLLKAVDGNVGVGFLENGSHSEESQNLLTEISHLHRRVGGVLRTVYIREHVQRAGVQKAVQDLVVEAMAGQTGKCNLGVSVWGKNLMPLALAKAAKSALREQGLNARFITNPDGVLTSAQVMHNTLDYERSAGKGVEIVVIQAKDGWYVGATLCNQDINSYSKRDFDIPAPDPVSGMVSPKLAQAMINLAVQADKKAVVYDPFCGNGRILLESWFMGIPAYGSDLVEKKVTSAVRNLEWLAKEFSVDLTPTVWVADATKPESRDLTIKTLKGKTWYMVGEPFLGRPLRGPLPPTEKETWLGELVPLYTEFFTRWSATEVATTDRPIQMLMVFPRVRMGGGGEASVYDQIIDRLEVMGYSAEVLFCYDRPDSHVRRDLVQVTYSN